MKDWLGLVVFLTVLTVGVVLFKRCSGSDNPQSIDIVTVRDTILIRDTVRIDAPQEVSREIVRYIPVKLPAVTSADTLLLLADMVVDSATVSVPIEQRHFSGDDYDAWVSGYQPQLDSLHLYRQNQIITEQTTITKWRNRRWGLSVGAGAALTPRGISPGIFVGISYTIYNF